jgi:hypothetical protein
MTSTTTVPSKPEMGVLERGRRGEVRGGGTGVGGVGDRRHCRRRQGRVRVEEEAAGEGERGRRVEVWARGVGGRDTSRLGRCGRELKLTRLK